MRSILLVPPLVLTLACAADRPPESVSPAEMQAQAAEALQIFIDSWNRGAAGDSRAPDDYGALYWPEAELVDPMGMIWDGRPAIVQMHADLWRGPFRGSQVTGSVRRVRALGPRTMIADFDFTLTLSTPPPPGTGPPGPLRALLKHVMEQRGGEWKVLAAQNTFSSSAPNRP